MRRYNNRMWQIYNNLKRYCIKYTANWTTFISCLLLYVSSYNKAVNMLLWLCGTWVDIVARHTRYTNHRAVIIASSHILTMHLKQQQKYMICRWWMIILCMAKRNSHSVITRLGRFCTSNLMHNKRESTFMYLCGH